MGIWGYLWMYNGYILIYDWQILMCDGYMVFMWMFDRYMLVYVNS